MRPQVELSVRSYLLLDDTVFDKHHGWRIELVRGQYSGNTHGVNTDIGLVTCVYNPETDQLWLIDYCLFTPNTDGKTNFDHVAQTLAQLAPRSIPHRTVPMGIWSATTALFKWLLGGGKTKSNVRWTMKQFHCEPR